eukprot:TRINITY_DN2331_c0_g1_i1.p1 TRINITY_DN2331_c0_g1~~TRINITY_DN2331_c0_g1_i1.p1  ORF type:complete len:290 (+),score=49.96 TRINITY_DN2331_c0_g1_i1:100-969(+)
MNSPVSSTQSSPSSTGLPADIKTVQEEIEKYSLRLDELLRSVENINEKEQGVTNSKRLKELVNTQLEAMEEKMKVVMTLLIDLSIKHKDDLKIVTRIMQLYQKISRLVSWGVSDLTKIAGVAAGKAHEIAEEKFHLSEIPEWGNTQLALLQKTYDKTNSMLSTEIRSKLDLVHEDIGKAFDVISQKVGEYSQLRTVAEARQKLNEDIDTITAAASVAATRTAYHEYPVLGYTADGTKAIITDSTKPIGTRIVYSIGFILITILSFLKACLWRFTSHMWGESDPSSGRES